MPARIGVVGANWRGEYFLRVASALPEHFEVTRVLTRTDASAERVSATWRVPATTSLEEFREGHFDFVVVAVPQAVAAELTVTLAREGHAVLAETPPAPSKEGLIDFYRDVEHLRVQIAEQYRFQPHHAARLRLAESGRLGPISFARVSAAHGYHGVSLLRAFLGIGFEPVEVSGWTAAIPVVRARGRDGWIDQPREGPSLRTFARLDYGSRSGSYEFDYEQYVSPIRPRYVEVYGLRGHLLNDQVAYLAGDRRAVSGTLQRAATGIDGDLDGWFVDYMSWGEEVLWRNRFPGARLNDDELAVAELMYRMTSYANGGEGFYGAADGCHDHLVGLAITEAVERSVPQRVDDVPWASSASALSR